MLDARNSQGLSDVRYRVFLVAQGSISHKVKQAPGGKRELLLGKRMWKSNEIFCSYFAHKACSNQE